MFLDKRRETADMMKYCQERIFDNPKLIKRYLDLLQLVGRRIISVDISDFDGSEGFGSPSELKKRKFWNNLSRVSYEVDFTSPFHICFEDGSGIELTARDDTWYTVQFEVTRFRKKIFQKSISRADCEYSAVLGHRIASVDIATEKNAKNSLGFWIDKKRHRQVDVIKWIVIRTDNNYSIRIGANCYDFVWYELNGPDGKMVEKSLAKGFRDANRFRKEYLKSVSVPIAQNVGLDSNAPDSAARRVNAIILNAPNARTFVDPKALRKALSARSLECRRISGFWLGGFWGDFDYGSYPLPDIQKTRKDKRNRIVQFKADAGLNIRFTDGSILFLHSDDSLEEPRVQFRFRQFDLNETIRYETVPSPENIFLSLALGAKIKSVSVIEAKSKTFSWGQRTITPKRGMISRVDIQLSNGLTLKFEPTEWDYVEYSLVDKSGKLVEQVPAEALRLAEKFASNHTYRRTKQP